MTQGMGRAEGGDDRTDLLRIARRLKAERDETRREVMRLQALLAASEKVLAAAIDAALERGETDT